MQYARYQIVIIANTFFKKKNKRKWAWESSTIAKFVNEIDLKVKNKMRILNQVNVLQKFWIVRDPGMLSLRVVFHFKFERRKSTRNTQ